MPTRTIAERLGTFAAELRLESLPAPVILRAGGCLLHALTVGLAGSAAGFGRLAEQSAFGLGTKPAAAEFARSLVSGQWHPAPVAAMINGAHLHARAQEDTHGTFHPGVSVIPAALAAAEASYAGGRRFLEAVVAGYEVGIALSAPLTELTTPPFRATAVFGPVAAAAAVGHIEGLNAGHMISAVSLAAAMAGGTSESFGAGTDEWHFQSGQAAMTGFVAARLARAGVRASRTAFEAAAGYLDCFSRSSQSAETIGCHLGSTWNILDVTFKPYPVCAFNQAPAILAVRLRAAGVHAPDVSSVQLRMNEREATYPGMPSSGPFSSTSQTLMSARFAFAAALLYGEITYASLRDFSNPELLECISRIELIPEPGRRAKTARASVTLVNGSRTEGEIDDTDSLLSWDKEEVMANAQRLAGEVRLSAGGFAGLVDSVNRLAAADSVEELIEATLVATTAGAEMGQAISASIHDRTVPRSLEHQAK